MNPPVELNDAPDGLLPGLGGESVLSARAGSSPGSGPGFGGAAPAQSFVMSPQQPDRAGRSRGEPEANHKGEQDLIQTPKSRQQKLEDALERAANAAEEAILHNHFAGANKAAMLAEKLSRALERVRKSAPEEKREGVFYSNEDIARARAELTRRLDRLAKTLRVDEGARPG